MIVFSPPDRRTPGVAAEQGIQVATPAREYVREDVVCGLLMLTR